MMQKFHSRHDGIGVSGFTRDGVPASCPTTVSEAQKQSAVSDQQSCFHIGSSEMCSLQLQHAEMINSFISK